MTEHDEVLSTIADGVASIVLNRPGRRNAITGPLGDGLAAAFAHVSARDDVGAVLFHGAGGSFCSGLDLKEYNADPPPAWMATARDSLVAAHRAIFDCPVPVVVALERFAINGGAAFALAADLLVVGREAYLQVGEIRQGMAAPMNLAWLLARHPASVAEQIALTGRRFVGPDLHRLGVALDVVDDDRVLESARALAVEIASYPTEQARAIKATIRDLAPATDLGDGGAWFDRANAGSPLPVGSAMRPRAVQ
ncbi:MAG: enoyl-CoA hydratase/isomerase family protein [Acidimicrobiales bacterium]|jgi:enoyl-CoA hydratase/carnithine racemase|nr:enoyl-CoA hydratase/isomerase family protein [Acidimicrobiales bacterium]